MVRLCCCRSIAVPAVLGFAAVIQVESTISPSFAVKLFYNDDNRPALLLLLQPLALHEQRVRCVTLGANVLGLNLSRASNPWSQRHSLSKHTAMAMIGLLLILLNRWNDVIGPGRTGFTFVPGHHLDCSYPAWIDGGASQRTFEMLFAWLWSCLSRSDVVRHHNPTFICCQNFAIATICLVYVYLRRMVGTMSFCHCLDEQLVRLFVLLCAWLWSCCSFSMHCEVIFSPSFAVNIYWAMMGPR